MADTRRIGGTRHDLPDGTRYYALDEIPLKWLDTDESAKAIFDLGKAAADEKAGDGKARH